MAVDTIDFARRFTLLSQSVAQPGAGLDWSVTVPAGEIWRVFCLSAQLVTSSTVATRTPAIKIKDGSGNIVYEQVSTGGQAASLTGQFSWAPAMPTQQNAPGTVNPIPPDLLLPEGFVITTQTFNIQAADQWSNVFILIGQAPTL